MTKKDVVIIGGGVGGLISAYELCKNPDYNVVVLEAREKLGGRNLSVRLGESITEVDDDGNEHVISAPSESDFGEDLTPEEKNELYLNAGPGRISSAHTNLIRYCKELGVELEVYIKESRSNLLKLEKNEPFVNREITYDVRGYISEYFAQKILIEDDKDSSEEIDKNQLLPWLRSFGALDNDYKYNGSARIGYKTLPGVTEGEEIKPLVRDDLINALTQIMGTNFYSVDAFLQQPTSFQCVGGNDQIIIKLEEKLQHEFENCCIYKNSPVKHIQKLDKRYLIEIDNTNVDGVQCQSCKTFTCDIVISNVPLSLVRDLISADNFDETLIEYLTILKEAKEVFMEPAFKIGWWSKRKYWQEPTTASNTIDTSNKPVFNDSGTIPIFGGISWTDDSIQQIWYPSSSKSLFDNYGVLTGAYRATPIEAREWGELKPKERLEKGLNNLVNLHKGWTNTDEWEEELRHNEYKKGMSIAWNKIPYIEMGWVNWGAAQAAQKHINYLEIYNYLAKLGDGKYTEQFYIVGDQVSNMEGYGPGNSWMEGAVASAINVVNKIMNPSYIHPKANKLPSSYNPNY